MTIPSNLGYISMQIAINNNSNGIRMVFMKIATKWDGRR